MPNTDRDTMANLVAEFTIEPFEAATPGPHVQSAIAVAEARVSADPSVSIEIGPFGTSIVGPVATVLSIVGAVNEAAVLNGATRVSLQLTVASADSLGVAATGT